MELNDKVRAVAQACVARLEATQKVPTGKRAADAALDYMCGAAQAAEIAGDLALFERLKVAVVFHISIRGIDGLRELAAEDRPKAA